MAGPYNFTGQNIENTYQRVLQTPDGITFYDGTGSLVTLPSANTASLLITASVNLNTITFTKGNGTTFPITVDTGSAGGRIYNTATGSYGSFYHTGSQTAVSATTIYSMSLSTTDISNGVYVSGSSRTRVYVTNAGVYNFQFSAQFRNTDTSDEQHVAVWIRKNNISSANDIVDSNSFISVPKAKGGNPGETIAAWNFFQQLAAGDFIELLWHAEVANVITLETIAAGTNPTHPRTPSLILTANRVDTFLSNTGSFSGSFTGNLIGIGDQIITGSVYITGSLNVTNGITGSLLGTASWASNTITASYITGSTFTSANPALSASYALTASYAINSVELAELISYQNALLLYGSGNIVVGKTYIIYFEAAEVTAGICVTTDDFFICKGYEDVSLQHNLTPNGLYYCAGVAVFITDSERWFDAQLDWSYLNQRFIYLYQNNFNIKLTSLYYDNNNIDAVSVLKQLLALDSVSRLNNFKNVDLSWDDTISITAPADLLTLKNFTGYNCIIDGSAMVQARELQGYLDDTFVVSPNDEIGTNRIILEKPLINYDYNEKAIKQLPVYPVNTLAGGASTIALNAAGISATKYQVFPIDNSTGVTLIIGTITAAELGFPFALISTGANILKLDIKKKSTVTANNQIFCNSDLFAIYGAGGLSLNGANKDYIIAQTTLAGSYFAIEILQVFKYN
jgi:hypothetical protein